jgi:HK97 family phage major capsid protein
MTPEEKSAQEALIAKVETAAKEAFEQKSAALVTEMKSLKDQNEKLMAEIKSAKPENYDTLIEEHGKLMAEVKSLKEGGERDQTRKTIAAQLKSAMEKNAEKFEAFKKGEQKAFSLELDFKAAGTMLISTNTGSSAYIPQPEFVPGYNPLVRNMPFVENYSNVSSTGSARIVWINQINPDGNAALTAEGAVKPLIDFDLQSEVSNAEKYADKIKVSTEMLEDIDFIAAAIENELRYKVDIVVDAALLADLVAYAPAFTLTTIETTTPGIADAILAAATQVRTFNFLANFAFINPVDWANMMLYKSTTGEYTNPIWISDNMAVIGGVTVVATNQIPAGDLLIGDMSKFVVRNYKPFTIQYGYVNDDFERNLVTIIGERRIHDYVSANHVNAFVYDTFSNIQTAITA